MAGRFKIKSVCLNQNARIQIWKRAHLLLMGSLMPHDVKKVKDYFHAARDDRPPNG